MKSLLCGLALFALTGCAPGNLTLLKYRETAYHDSGRYMWDFNRAVEPASRYLAAAVKHVRPGEKPAIVFDIDETCVSNWTYLQENDYAIAMNLFKEWAANSACPPLPATQRLYQEARRAGVTVFFVTGRPEVLRAATKRNLARAGYGEYAALYMKPASYAEASIIPFKSASRRAIEAQGYTILLSIGDQWSDLKGGYARKTFKLPNPFYYLP